MENALHSAARKLKRIEKTAHDRRVMWIAFEQRLRSVFEEFDGLGGDAETLGHLYFSRGSGEKSNLDASMVLNFAQISTGWRRLGVWHSIKPNKPGFLEEAMEAGACISFSQDMTGRVTVLVSPYESKLARVNEENIILKFGASPDDLTKRHIRRLLKTFFQYCAATSMVANESYGGYLFRQWLRLRDFRNKKIQRIVLWRAIEKAALLLFSVASLLATLWTSAKWPKWPI
jgi:hypothetical protein